MQVKHIMPYIDIHVGREIFPFKSCFFFLIKKIVGGLWTLLVDPPFLTLWSWIICSYFLNISTFIEPFFPCLNVSLVSLKSSVRGDATAAQRVNQKKLEGSSNLGLSPTFLLERGGRRNGYCSRWGNQSVQSANGSRLISS